MLKNMREFRKKIKNIWEWYVLGYYHCDKCPYSWEDMDYYGECNDCGCYRFGELRDTCRHIRNPISQLIVNARINDNLNSYDCWVDYGEQYEICEQIAMETNEKIENGEWVTDTLRKFYAEYEHGVVDIMMDITHEYEMKVHPHRTPKEKLKDAFREWREEFVWKHFKRYFRRKRK